MPGRIVEQRYEDIVSNPNETLSDVWNLLDIQPVDASEFYKASEPAKAADTSYMWENLTKPLMDGNFNKFYSEWNYSAVYEMESVIGDGLADFGYLRSDPKMFSTTDGVPRKRNLSDKDKALTSAQEVVFAKIVDRLKSKG